MRYARNGTLGEMDIDGPLLMLDLNLQGVFSTMSGCPLFDFFNKIGGPPLGLTLSRGRQRVEPFTMSGPSLKLTSICLRVLFIGPCWL